jgi:hypothetical protein
MIPRTLLKAFKRAQGSKGSGDNSGMSVYPADMPKLSNSIDLVMRHILDFKGHPKKLDRNHPTNK